MIPSAHAPEPAEDPEPAPAVLHFLPNAPFVAENLAPPKAELAEEFADVGASFVAYRRALRELIAGEFAPFKAIIPQYMVAECRTVVLFCTDGVLVRYEPVDDPHSNLMVGLVKESLEETAPGISNRIIHVPENPQTYVPPSGGMTFQGLATDRETGATRVVFEGEMNVIVARSNARAAQESRPAYIAAIQNVFEVTTEGERVFVDGKPHRDNKFIARTKVRARVPWCAIEVYPPTDPKRWDPAQASQWARADVQSVILSHTLKEQHFHGLDNRVELRRQFAALLAELRSLLAGPEEPVHQFFKRAPSLLCPVHLRSWSKHPFGRCFSDFVFLAPHNDYLLVELEAPLRRLFRKNGHPCAELSHAIAQVRDWTSHLQDHKAEVEKDLPGISATPRSLVVIGRSAELTPENRRHLSAMESEIPRLKIMTYDDLVASATASLQHIVGPLDTQIGPDGLVYFYTGIPTAREAPEP